MPKLSVQRMQVKNFPKGEFFLPCFLYFTKSRKRTAVRRKKDLILFVRSRHCSELNRGLQNLDFFFEKGFNFVSADLSFMCADSRFVKPRSFPVRETDWYFLRRAKSNQKAHGVCRPGRDKLSAKRKVSKGFNFVRGKPPLRRAESRFCKPRFSPQNDNIAQTNLNPLPLRGL